MNEVTANVESDRPQIRFKIDDNYTSLTTDAVRVWFITGDKPDDTASVVVMIRSVGFNNDVQMGMHEYICKTIRGAIEEMCSRTEHVIRVRVKPTTGEGGQR